ncbi:hypothetical protein ACFX2J_019847 [Malus domestica]
MSNFMAASNQNQNPNKSFEVTHPPNDSISSLSFSPKSNILVATSWDNQVCVILGDTPEWTKLLVCPRHPYPMTNR